MLPGGEGGEHDGRQVDMSEVDKDPVGGKRNQRMGLVWNLQQLYK